MFPRIPNTPRNVILVTLVIGLAARAFVSVFFTFVNDINYWIVVSNNLTSNEGLYGLPGYYYYPAWGYFLAAFTAVANLLGVSYGEFDPDLMGSSAIRDWSTVVPDIWYALLLKLCLIAADVLVGYVIYRIGTHVTGEQRKGALMFAAWFLCPLTIMMSCDRLMFENVEILFFLLSFYMMLLRRPVESGLMMGVSLMLKPYCALLAVIMIAYALTQDRSPRYALTYILSSAASVLVIMAPVLVNGELDAALYWFSSRAESVASGYNFTIVIMPILIAITVLFCMAIVRHRITDPRTVLLLATIPTAGMMVIPGNVQYYLVLLPFVILALGRYGWAPMALLSILGVLALLVHIEADSMVYLSTGWLGEAFLEWLSDIFASLKDASYDILKTLSAVVVMALPLYALWRGDADEAP